MTRAILMLSSFPLRVVQQSVVCCTIPARNRPRAALTAGATAKEVALPCRS
jgi:hypothetical protein